MAGGPVFWVFDPLNRVDEMNRFMLMGDATTGRTERTVSPDENCHARTALVFEVDHVIKACCLIRR